MKLQDISVARKFLASNIVVLVILSLAGLWLEHSVSAAQKEATSQVEQIERVITLGTEWKGLSDATTQRVITAALLTEAPSFAQKLDFETNRGIKAISTLQEELKKTANKSGDQEAIARIGDLRQTVLSDLKNMAELKAAGNSQELQAFIEGRLMADLGPYFELLDRFVSMQEQHRVHAKKAAAAATRTAEVTSYSLMVLAAVGSFLWMWMLSRSIVVPLQRAVGVANAIAAGDLTQTLTVDDRKDEVGALMTSLGAMNARLRRVVSEVRRGVETVSTASSEIAASNADHSLRTERAAANLQEAAASMEELTGVVSHSADSARQASTLVNSAAQAARRGHEVVDQVVARMNDISDSSHKISEITSTIDGIAFQTNLLALNAAVEAARAGAQGKGFAVVASEVRALASRSAEAAKQIKALIAASVDKVDTGAALVAQTGEVMSEIVLSVKRATDMMNEISAATTEQLEGITQVNRSVTHLDEVTQQNAALVEQSVAAATSLRDQATNLFDLVGIFNVGADVRSQNPGGPGE
jgi:methyl-accepting chemotaxis protein